MEYESLRRKKARKTREQLRNPPPAKTMTEEDLEEMYCEYYESEVEE